MELLYSSFYETDALLMKIYKLYSLGILSNKL